MNQSISPGLPDYHTHHELCRHASGRTIDYARAAAQAGIEEICATDHCPTDVEFGKEHRMTLEQFDQYRDDVRHARDSVPDVTLLFGVEADYYPGCEEFLKMFCDREEFDLVLGSIHFIDYWSNDPVRRGLSDAIDPDFVWREYYRMTGELADTGLYDILTHPDLPKRFGNRLNLGKVREYALPALDRLAAAGMAIEINTSGMIHSIQQMYPGPEFLSWAAERGIGLVFGSDAHTPDRVGDRFAEAKALAKDAGFKSARRYRKRTWTAYNL
ncbi:MAG TPA: histidinol-phosphatase HisJ family protein [Kiritimatiellia bacterium]|nr:histidinol-phosphatase HisJ family protein [Kiritimatiellia bacterium]